MKTEFDFFFFTFFSNKNSRNALNLIFTYWKKCFVFQVIFLILALGWIFIPVYISAGVCIQYKWYNDSKTTLNLSRSSRFLWVNQRIFSLVAITVNLIPTIVTIERRTPYPLRKPEFTRGFTWSSCSSIFSFLCSMLYIIVRLFVLFFVIALPVLRYPFGIFTLF